MVKNLPVIQETWVQSLSWEDPLEEEMATHSNILAWKISWTEEPGGYSQRVTKSPTQLSNKHFHFFTSIIENIKIKANYICLLIYESEKRCVSCSVVSTSMWPRDNSLLDFSVHEIFQARILEWATIPFSRGFSQPKDWTQISGIAGSFLTNLSHQGSPNIY